MLPAKGEAGDRARQGGERLIPLIPYEAKLTPRRFHRLHEADLALDAQRRRSRRAPHNVAADAADRAPSAARAIGVAAPGAWPLRWTRAAALAASEATLRHRTSFIAFYEARRTGAPP